MIRYWQTLRYLALRQILSRVRVRVLRKWWRMSARQAIGGVPLAQTAAPGVNRPTLLQPMAQHQLARALVERLTDNEFEFLQQRHRFDGEIAWQCPGQSRLWGFHLHYFGYVRELMLADVNGADAGFQQFRRLSAAWMAGNVRVTGDGWHPYTLSLRIINWLKAVRFWRLQMEREMEWFNDLSRSLRHQAHLLLAQLEYDVRGNHLLENARALVWLGLLTDDVESSGWLRRGEKILQLELHEQVLNDGCHFERSPGYHFSILLSLTELCCLLELTGRVRPPWLESAVRKMMAFGWRIMTPDGTYPLLKDSSYDQVPVSPRMILSATSHVMSSEREIGELQSILFFGLVDGASAPVPYSISEESSGFLTAGGGGEALVFDVGAPCPDYLPAHAHADALTYEFHVQGRPLVTDSGVFEYAPGTWREHFRSTPAHNTVSVDGRNSSDVWGSFRVGRRAKVRLIGRHLSEHEAVFEAEHDGFTHLPGAPRHRRIVMWRQGEWLAVMDVLLGEGRHIIENFVHFHPWIQLGASRPAGVGRVIPLSPVGWFLVVSSDCRVETVCGREEHPRQGWYSSGFGRREPASVVRLAADVPLPFASAYLITANAELSAIAVSQGGCWRLEIRNSEGVVAHAVTSANSDHH